MIEFLVVLNADGLLFIQDKAVLNLDYEISRYVQSWGLCHHIIRVLYVNLYKLQKVHTVHYNTVCIPPMVACHSSFHAVRGPSSPLTLPRLGTVTDCEALSPRNTGC